MTEAQPQPTQQVNPYFLKELVYTAAHERGYTEALVAAVAADIGVCKNTLAKLVQVPKDAVDAPAPQVKRVSGRVVIALAAWLDITSAQLVAQCRANGIELRF